jgi:RimJ/RimL family protein N-acetyltransferase
LRSGSLELREPAPADAGALIDLLALTDPSRFGVDTAVGDRPVSDATVREMIERIRQHRIEGRAFTYLITRADERVVVGMIQMRQLDPAFETAEWECVIVPASRGTGVFLQAARLVGRFAFDTLGTGRIEARVLMHNQRAFGALRKLGAVQEGILRGSFRRGEEHLDQALWTLLKEDLVWRPIHGGTQ